jgi:hypothetical protein
METTAGGHVCDRPGRAVDGGLDLHEGDVRIGERATTLGGQPAREAAHRADEQYRGTEQGEGRRL